jgi:2-keto-4-pentenoate hydratase/2-oxohepta-3-ene-1,7-dioic acid hydratase in catechol pathway
MKLVTFQTAQNLRSRIGVLLPSTTTAQKYNVLDLSCPTFSHSAQLQESIYSMNSFIENENCQDMIQELKKRIEKSQFSASSVVGGSDAMLLTPLSPVRNILCIGKNYEDHVAEIARVTSKGGDAASTPPTHAAPMYFTKATTTVIGPNDWIERHAQLTSWLDYEAELAVIIGKKCRDVKEENAKDVIFGYSIANDVTARELQKRHGQFFKGKSLDRTCPIGPCIVPACDLDPSDLAIKLWLNGELKQNSRTSKMITNVPQMVASLSAGMTLLPGDIILTGTPDGVGYAAKPPRTMQVGDQVTIEIEHIGFLHNHVK